MLRKWLAMDTQTPTSMIVKSHTKNYHYNNTMRPCRSGMGNAAQGRQSRPRASETFPRFQQIPCTNKRSVISNTGPTGRAWKIPETVRTENCAAHTNLGNINTTRPAGQAWVILPLGSIIIILRDPTGRAWVMLPKGANPARGPLARGWDWGPRAALPMPDQRGA